MARASQSHREHMQQEEPQRLTAAAARSTEDDSARLRADLAAAEAELAFDTEPPTGRITGMSVGAHSILAGSDHSSGETEPDAVPASLDESASQRPLRTSVFTKLASQLLLTRASADSSQSSDGYGSAPSGQFNDSLIRSPEFDKISMDSTPVTQSAMASETVPPLLRTTDLSTTSTTGSNYNHNYEPTARAPSMRAHGATAMYAASSSAHDSMDMSAGPSVSMVNDHGRAARDPTTSGSERATGRARVSSDLSSVQREMDNNAFASSPVSEAMYLNMRKTLDPEALLNGDIRNTANMAVLSSLRPVADPFDLTRDPNLPGLEFQRRRAATTGAMSSMAVAGGNGRSTTGRLTGNMAGQARGSTRSQRSWTVTGSGQAPPPAPVILAHDPRGTFRTTTADTAQQIFASQQVRLQNKWSTDVWIYMKNAHPFLGICTAHRWHPYKKKDRALVLLTTLLLAIFLCGLYATQQCCQTAADSAVAVVTNNSKAHHRTLVEHPTRMLADDVNCKPFGASCDATQNLCTLGSSCVDSKCVPLEPATAKATQCSATTTTTQCPAGWRCSPSRGECRPSASLVCYLPAASAPNARGVSFAAEDGEEIATDESIASGSGSNGAAPVDAISVIAKLIEYSKENNKTAAPPTTTTPSPTTSTPVPTTVAPMLNAKTSNATTATPSTPQPTVASDLGVDGDDAVLDPAAMNATVEKLLITLTKPTDGGVYTVSSTIPIAWEVKVLEGERSFVNTLRFRVDFSRDGHTFDMVASDIESDSVLEVSPIKYHFDWDLALNESLACSSCVLRVCTQQDDASADPVCIRTDGATALTSTSTTSTTGGLLSASTATDSAASPKITFHIVRDVLACACGIKHSAFVTYSYLLALVFPVALLFFEQFVTFYQDSKVLGMFARRGGPKMPVVGFYAAEATKRGRVLLALVCVGLIFACGMVAARITSATFPESTDAIAVLWVLMFLLVLVVGFIYCSAIYCVVFTVRWYQDEKTWHAQGGGAADFAMMFDDHSHNATMLQSQQMTHPMPSSQQDPGSVRSYQWPYGDMTNSSRSNYSTAVVTQRSGQAIV